MATYKEIHGVKLQYRESDATAIIGDVWYNATTAVLKMFSSVDESNRFSKFFLTEIKKNGIGKKQIFKSIHTAYANVKK